MESQGGFSDDEYQRLCALVFGHPLISAVLRNWSVIAVPDCWISGSIVAQARWNQRFGFPPEHGIADVDLVYFDNSRASEGEEAAEASRIREAFSDFPLHIDLKNQARVHEWYEHRFGYAIEPYTSAAQAITTFPTTAGAIGIRPMADGLEVIAPFGLEDLLAPLVRPNKIQITCAIYEQKVERWKSTWPELEISPW